MPYPIGEHSTGREGGGRHRGSTHVEDEVLVGGLDGEPAAELDGPDQNHGRRRDGQRVRRVREGRRSHAKAAKRHRSATLSSFSCSSRRPGCLVPLFAPRAASAAAANDQRRRDEWRERMRERGVPVPSPIINGGDLISLIFCCCF